jgi:predicted metal-binding protein
MKPFSIQVASSPVKKDCTGFCPGYGTYNFCPPLIVLAVLAANGTALSQRMCHSYWK